MHVLLEGATVAENTLLSEVREQGRIAMAKELMQRRLEWLAAFEHDTSKRVEDAMRRQRPIGPAGAP